MNNQGFTTYTEKLAMETQYALKNAPSGSLNIKYCKGTVQFYYRPDDPSLKYTYIHKSNHSLICQLAQKDYNKKIIKLLMRILNRARQLQSDFHYYDINRFDDIMFAELYKSLDIIYDSLSQERKDMIKPIVPTTRQYIKNWLDLPYTKRKFAETDNTAYFTKNQVRVRSKSELFIGNFLIDAGLPYKYECPIIINGITVHPDFTVLDACTRRIKYIEHCGMMDNPEYADNFIRKINLYIANGIFPGNQLILTYESLKFPLDTRTLDSLITYNFPYANIFLSFR